ncbi:membrane protein insertion efficiency factor YidD [Corynebacterium sp. c8Ua_99]
MAERAILFYRRRISNLKPTSTCRFEPTCSAYGLEAVRRFGAIRGLWLTLLRIFRCAPWHPGGWNPVPATFPGLGSWLKRMHR